MLSFDKLTEQDLELLLQWRTSEHVTQYMYTDIEKDMNMQRKWFESIRNDRKQHYWMIRYKGIPIGLISLNQIDEYHKRATFGYYIGDLNYSIIAGTIHPYLYNFAFFELGLHKLYAEVMEGNEGMAKMHVHYGFRQVGTYKQHIYKYGRYHDVMLFELLASDWKKDGNKNHKYQAKFPI